MNDLISRQAAKSKKVYSHERHEYVVPVAELDWLPSAQPEPKHGKWLKIVDLDTVQCSECFEEFDYIDGLCYLCHGQELPDFCPQCGARMESE